MTRSSSLGPLPDAPRVILASASRTRRVLLANAGIVATSEAADIDEGAVKQLSLIHI